MPAMSMTPTMTPKALALPRLHSGQARFTEPFPCFLCGTKTRPPKARAHEPGMEGTRSYGGRGCCTSCYQKSKAQLPRRAYNQPHSPTPLDDVFMEHTRKALEHFLQRRRERLLSGSTGGRGHLAGSR